MISCWFSLFQIQTFLLLHLFLFVQALLKFASMFLGRLYFYFQFKVFIRNILLTLSVAMLITKRIRLV